MHYVNECALLEDHTKLRSLCLCASDVFYLKKRFHCDYRMDDLLMPEVKLGDEFGRKVVTLVAKVAVESLIYFQW